MDSIVKFGVIQKGIFKSQFIKIIKKIIKKIHEVHTSSTACGKMWKSLMSWGSVMNHRRVQWNHGEAQRQHLPASAAGRGSRARVRRRTLQYFCLG